VKSLWSDDSLMAKVALPGIYQKNGVKPRFFVYENKK